MRVAVGVQYDGSGFQGWQAQRPGVRTVQTVLEQALARVADQSVRVAPTPGCMASVRWRISTLRRCGRREAGCWAATLICRWMSA